MAKTKDQRRTSVSSDELVLYRQLRRRYRVLDDDEFGCLFDACHNASDEQVRRHARTLIAYSNIGLVISIARRFVGQGVSLAELVDEGLMSVYIDSIDHFKPERGCKFSTYATCWIHKTIRRLVDTAGTFTPMRLPVHVVDDRRRIGTARGAFRESHGREPSFDELVGAVQGLRSKTARGMKPTRLTKILANEPGASISLSATLDADGGRTLLDRLGRGDGASSTAAIEALDEMSVHLPRLKNAIESLEGIWPDVIGLYYGWFGDPPTDLTRIGKRYGFSRQWMSQVQHKALKIIGRQLGKAPEEVHALLTIAGDATTGPLLDDRRSPPDETVSSPESGEGERSLEEDFAILCQHATNWRERGEVIVFAPVSTLVARERASTLAGARRCVATVVSKGWAEWVGGGMDAVKLRRLDKLPAPKDDGRSSKRMLRLKRHTLVSERTPCRKPTVADVYRFLDGRAIECGDRWVVRPAVTLLCVRYKLEPQAAVRFLVELYERGAVASSDEWKSIVLTKKGLPKRTDSAVLARHPDDGRLHASAVFGTRAHATWPLELNATRLEHSAET
jgi:RNA polymerase sigma factor (sigma-70 family)